MPSLVMGTIYHALGIMCNDAVPGETIDCKVTEVRTVSTAVSLQDIMHKRLQRIKAQVYVYCILTKRNLVTTTTTCSRL